MLTEEPIEIFKTSIMQSRSSLELAHSYIHIIEKPEPMSIDVLKDIKRMASDLYTLLQNRYDSE
jgi:hypothetical protein